MATSQDLPGKKPATKTTTTLTVKKTPAKKVATPAATKTTVAKVPVAKTPASKAESSKAAGTKSTANKQAINAPVANTSVSPEERYKMIAAAAYSKAEHRGFASGYALNDWIAAEKEIDRMLEAQTLALA